MSTINDIPLCNEISLLQTEAQRFKDLDNKISSKDAKTSGIIAYCLVALIIAALISASAYVVNQLIKKADEEQQRIVKQLEDIDVALQNYDVTEIPKTGWDEYEEFCNKERALLSGEDYDRYTDIYIDYILNQYRLVNISDVCIVCDEIGYLKELVSDNQSEKLDELISQAEEYVNQYKEIRDRLYFGDYNSALRVCLELESAGADSFEFAGLFAETLIELGYYDKAFEYVKNYVNTYDSLTFETLDSKHRIMLIEFIKPYLSEKQQKECDNMVSTGFDESNVHSDFYYQYHNVKSKDTVENDAAYSLIHDLDWLNKSDLISVEENAVLFKGQECYPINVSRKNGSNTIYYKLFEDVSLDKLYVVFGEQYSNIYRGMEWWINHNNQDLDANGYYQNCVDSKYLILLSDIWDARMSYDSLSDIARGDMTTGYTVDVNVFKESTDKSLLEIQKAYLNDSLIHGKLDSLEIVILNSDKLTCLIKNDNDEKYTMIEGIYQKVQQ